MYVNTSGTFGVASATCWWSRAAILGTEVASWLLLVADDLSVLMSYGKIPRNGADDPDVPSGHGFPLSPGRNWCGESDIGGL